MTKVELRQLPNEPKLPKRTKLKLKLDQAKHISTTINKPTRAAICIIGRCVTTDHKDWDPKRQELVKTTKRLVGANQGQIELDGALFLNLTLGNAYIILNQTRRFSII